MARILLINCACVKSNGMNRGGLLLLVNELTVVSLVAHQFMQLAHKDASSNV